MSQRSDRPIGIKRSADKGATALSYGLVVGLIAVVALGSISSIGSSGVALFGEVNDSIGTVAGAGSSDAGATPAPTVDVACAAAPQSFDAAGAALQAVTVPAGCEIADAKIWGAGGGTFSGSCSGCQAGGPGGYTRASIPVSPGGTIYIAVGIGGEQSNTGTGGWPGGGTSSSSGGGGGGLSGVFGANAVTQGNAMAIAGGGGGSALTNSPLGYGGGENGGTGSNGNALGGDQTGAGGQLAIDGEDSAGGGGGGGGYFGGMSQDTNINAGGGSGYLNAGAGVTGTTEGISTGNIQSEAALSPPNTTDPDYISPRGRGASDGNSGNPSSGDGLVVIIWGDG